MIKKLILNDYILERQIGSGTNCKVHLAFNKQSGKYCALKVVKNNDNVNSHQKAINNEIDILQKLNHPNIINLIDHSNKGTLAKSNGIIINFASVFFSALELARNGEIFDYIKETGNFPEKVSRFYFKQLISALEECNSKGISHRDLKLENIFLDGSFNMKIGDFGCSSSQTSQKELTTICGTEGYAAPEVFRKVPYDGTSVDIFAAGVILFILYAGYPPFCSTISSNRHYRLISHNNHHVFWKKHTVAAKKGDEFFSDDFKNLVNSMLAYEPKDRPSIAQIKKHPWFVGQTATQYEVLREMGLRKPLVDTAREEELVLQQVHDQPKKSKATEPNYAYENLSPGFIARQ